MHSELSALEARVIGCLIEKEITTPEYYPLTLNSLMTACNQKSNRDPVVNLSEAQVQDTVEALIARRLVSDESSFNSRTPKYQHRFCNTEFGDLKLNNQELAVICCLLLRGPQTPGELRTRTNRLCHFSDVKETESILEQLLERGLVVKLAREPGKRESRYQHLFCGEVDMHSVAASTEMELPSSRIDELEQQVAMLRHEVAELRALITNH
ncbi:MULTISPECIES: YceH family protein [Vibrio]|uniref:YceH family protein n=1 Tax=Vibrio TaxID=662 RepID=UPI000933CCAF|nr:MULTISPECIES: YceH family protein [Vibrio]MBC3616159.1 YceH family protein [Vibrio metschnikovii]MBC5812171.1 YceH family protein [Vibrio metschnikovii]MBC5831755.1 YceH family protein [Vibrio metschnikovii]